MLEAIIFLAAAIIAVPIFNRLGLGAILGYLAAGAVIGPAGLALIHDPAHTLHLSEFGVVMLLFVLGLELEPARLWRMRGKVFGLGGAQAALSSLLIGAALLIASSAGLIAAGLDWKVAIVIAIGLSLSSTAFAVQVLADRHELTQPHGQASFGILLFQDLLAIPTITVATLVAGGGAGGAPNPLHAIGAILGLIFIGKFVLRPVLRWIAATHNHELSVSLALLVVLGAAEAMILVNLTPSLGGFIAGVLLADSEYKHEIEANIESFKGLLLGLFFIAVGMSAQLDLLVQQPLFILGGTLLLFTLKGAVLLLLARLSRINPHPGINMAIALGSGGEFAFVVFSTLHAGGSGPLPKALHGALILIVTCSMALIPIFFLLRDRLIRPQPAATAEQAPDEIEAVGPVILAGFGRFNQIVGRVLRSKRIPFTALDNRADRVDFVRRFGNKVFYGDPARLDILRAARAGEARAIVIGVDGVEESLKIARAVKEHFPNVPVFARARDRDHAFQLIDLGVHVIVRELFHSSLEMSREVLVALGMPPLNAARAIERFRDHDEQQLRHQATIRDDDAALRASAIDFAAQLEQLFNDDAEEDFQSTP